MTGRHKKVAWCHMEEDLECQVRGTEQKEIGLLLSMTEVTLELFQEDLASGQMHLGGMSLEEDITIALI